MKKPQPYDDGENDVEEFDVEKMLAATDVSISSPSKYATRRQHKRRVPTRNDDAPRRISNVVAKSYALIGCIAILGTLSTTATDLQSFTRHLQAGTRRLASCVVAMAVDEEDAAIESTFATWESMFSVAFLREKREETREWCEEHGGCHSANAPSLPPSTEMAFIVSLTTCPDDDVQPGVDNRYDPKRAFYDAAALLKYSVCEECAEVNVASKFNHTFYAIVHPLARICSDEGRGEYDRVEVLQSLGYRVEVKGEPLGIEDISDPYLSANVESDVGIRDLMKLHAYTLTRHKVVVLIDFNTMLLQPLDGVVDDLMASPARAAFAMDYATLLPANGLNHGANMGLFLLKPSFASFNELIELYKTTSYDPMLGWNSQGVAGFDGSMGTSGLLTHYYRSKPFIELDKCIYNNDASNPHSDDGFCRNGDAHCDDCRFTITNKIEAGRFSSMCGKPWECSWDDSWDAGTKQICREYHRHWFANRLRFEQEFWVGAPQPRRNGTLHTEVFLGYCAETGSAGYELMIPDNYSVLTGKSVSDIVTTGTASSLSALRR
mmetsp:Transcript_8467/g.23723  ORF Transcript_8467/g.23723 Transcript_8467/m.23723 type:complete len:549 (+) Transcript_8467:178-1824(+)